MSLQPLKQPFSKKGTRFHVKTKLLICLETKQPNKQMGILQVLLPVLGVPAQDWSVSSCAMAGCSQWRSCRAAGEPLWQQHWAMVCKVLFFHLTTFGWVFWGQIYPQLAFGSLGITKCLPQQAQLRRVNSKTGLTRFTCATFPFWWQTCHRHSQDFTGSGERYYLTSHVLFSVLETRTINQSEAFSLQFHSSTVITILFVLINSFYYSSCSYRNL